MPIKTPERKAARAIYREWRLAGRTKEQYLWFAVLDRAIRDIRKGRNLSSGRFFRYPDESMAYVCENIDVEPSLIYRVLEMYNLWPPVKGNGLTFGC